MIKRMPDYATHKRRKLFLNLTIMLASVAVIVAVGYYVPRTLAPDDGDALVGGQLESGYPATGFLISSGQDGASQQCTAVFVSNGSALTAGHCARPGDQIFVGSGEFNLDRLIEALDYAFYPLWQQAQIAENDLIKIDIPYLLSGSSVAQISTPTVGCNYIIVAYGRNEEGVRGLRKSADFCVRQIDSQTFRLVSNSGAVCFGDSGSPVFRKDTNEVVGVVSQIANSDDAVCDFDDEVVATRLDVKREFVAAPITDSNSDFVPPAPGTGNFLTNFVSQVTRSPIQLLMAAIGFVVGISVVILIRTLFSKQPQSEQEVV